MIRLMFRVNILCHVNKRHIGMSVNGQLKHGFKCTCNTLKCVISWFEDLEGVGVREGAGHLTPKDFQSY